MLFRSNTEPDARLTVGGRPVHLRPDGSFSVRWLLPDGDFRVPVVAKSRDGMERREAHVRLTRSTTAGGDVGVHRMAPGPADPISGWTD